MWISWAHSGHQISLLFIATANILHYDDEDDDDDDIVVTII
jgi:hypothetical protein